ncbi:MAG: hypothetical protein LBN39_00300 [Planctomycetaceae bacterium]|jgi:hypothetical protein|nr:hypothetical protein [Planctomycetaceae bacterium]
MRSIILFCAVLFFAANLNAAEIILLSDSFTSSTGTYVPHEPRWDNLGVYHGTNGAIQCLFKVPEKGTYRASVLYASGEKRPFTFSLKRKNGEIHGLVDTEPTGSFFAKDLKWKAIPYTIFLETGEAATLTISFKGCMPHIKGIVLTNGSSAAHSSDIFDKAEQAVTLQPVMAANREKARKLMPGTEEILFIERATFQSSHYYTDFIDGSVHFGTGLCVLNLKDGSVRSLVPGLKDGIIGRCNLSFDGKKAIFDYKRRIGEGFRIWEVNLDGTGLKQLTFPPAEEEERIAKYRMDKNNKKTQIWAGYRGIGAGTYQHHTDDIHPCYLPGGGFVFTSTRCEHGILCDGPDILTVSVLYKATLPPDGGSGYELEKLSDNALSESCPTVMEDGRILYTRWEYVDNGSVTNKGLWAINSDGTGSQEIYGIDLAYPSVFNVARQIPGKQNEFVCIGAPHMPLGVGTVLLVDSAYNRRTVDGARYITPEIDQQTQSTWVKAPADKPFTKLYEPPQVKSYTIQTDRSRDGGGNTDTGPLYMDPFPIDEHNFIVTHNPNTRWNDVNGWALYLINDKGGRDLLYKPEEKSAWCPIPVRATVTPPSPQGLRLPFLEEQKLAQLVVVDVYAGMDNVKRGSVKYLRINEHVPRPWSARRYWDGDEYDQQHSVITMKTHLGLKVQHGIVNVEDDGSANFYVPADKNIFLQALDENYREIQRERTFVNYRPGEVRSCIGCHEQASDTRGQHGFARPKALKRSPQMPGPQPGETSGARPLSYFDDVQPVLDKYCVSCHNENCTVSAGGLPPAQLDLRGDLTTLFNRSYETLMDWNAMPLIRENYPKAGNNHYLPPYTLGSYSSKLVKLLDDGHYGVKVPLEDMLKITTWVDSNGQYYGSYFGRKNLKYKDDPNFRPKPKFENADEKQ